MKITEKTPYSAFYHLEGIVDQHTKENLAEAAERRFFGSFYEMTIGDFIRLTDSDLSVIGVEQGKEDKVTVLQVYCVKAFGKFVDELVKKLEAMRVPSTIDEQQAQERCMKSTMAEGMLLFARSYFGLHSFKEAESIIIADYLIAKKDAYNKAVFERALADIQRRKIKNHSKQ